MVEGGPRTARAFLETEAVVDRVVIYQVRGLRVRGTRVRGVGLMGL